MKKKFSQRTHNCGELAEYLVGAKVSLAGWIDIKRNERFLTLRDGHGTTQLVVPLNVSISRSKIIIQTLVNSKES